MLATTTVHVRVNKEIRDQAAAILEARGLSVSEAVRIFLSRVAHDQEFPLAPNEATLAAMEEGDGILAEKEARWLHEEHT